MDMEKKRKPPGKRRLLLFLLITGMSALAVKALWGGQGAGGECILQPEGTYRVCYLLNVDGMKGLGHSALLLLDENGEGKLFSYNGMEYNLFQCLLGKKGMGRMKEFSLDADTLREFLETGELPAGEYEECSNFDRALWREISREEYDVVTEKALHYIEAEEEYGKLCEELYALERDAAPGEGASQAAEASLEEARQRLEEFRAREDTPLYQIYTHNCDTAAREMIAAVDGDMAAYNASEARLTPKGNYKNMCRKLGGPWKFCSLEEDTWVERLLFSNLV